MTRLTSSIIHSPHSRTLQSLMPSWLQELVSVPTNPCVVQFSPPIAVVVAAKVPASSHPLTERSTLAGEYARAIETMAGLGSPSTSICCSGNGEHIGTFRLRRGGTSCLLPANPLRHDLPVRVVQGCNLPPSLVGVGDAAYLRRQRH
jgi:hypothetical protein